MPIQRRSSRLSASASGRSRSAWRQQTDKAAGFDQVLLRWRLESTTAAIRFIDGLLGD
jgi:hypothetical protein